MRKTRFTATQSLMPLPRHITDKEGHLKLHRGSAYCADPLFDPLKPVLEQQLQFNEGCEDILLTRSEKPLSDEGYILKVTPHQVVARASTCKGMFAALQTLRQLMLAGDLLIPCCEIEDEPDIAYRGFMIDLSRHMFSVDQIKKLIDGAALHHINVVHLHLTDDQGWRIPIPGYGKLESIAAYRKDPEQVKDSRYGGFYTHDQIKEIVEFAANRFVTVIPEIDMPGHCSALLAAYPEFGFAECETETRWGIFSNILNPESEALTRFIEKSLDTLTSLFPGPYIHIGGDECPTGRWELSDECMKVMKEKGLTPSRYQGEFTAKIARMVTERGKTPIGWDEVWEFSDPANLPEDLVISSWRGKEIDAPRVIHCSKAEGCYLDYKYTDSPDEPGAPNRISSLEQAAEFDHKEHFGCQANLWTEYVKTGREAEYLTFPRLSLLSERFWHPASQSPLSRLESEYVKLDRLNILSYREPLAL